MKTKGSGMLSHFLQLTSLYLNYHLSTISHHLFNEKEKNKINKYNMCDPIRTDLGTSVVSSNGHVYSTKQSCPLGVYFQNPNKSKNARKGLDDHPICSWSVRHYHVAS